MLDAARARFAEHGYDGTRLRDVAADAGVDVALVSYFFGSKDGLFAAAMALEVNPAQLVEELMRDGIDGLGERLLRTLLALLDAPGGSPFVALVRSAATNERAADAAARLRRAARLLGRLAARDRRVPIPSCARALAGSQVVGVVMARYVIGVRPLAERRSASTLAAAIGPTLERYLTGDVATRPRRASRRP